MCSRNWRKVERSNNHITVAKCAHYKWKRLMNAIVHGIVSLQRTKKKRFGAKVSFSPKHVDTNNDSTFVGELVLRTLIDLKEEHCPSKVKKFGSNSNASNTIRNNLIRWNIQCNVCFKCRAIFNFTALNNHKKEELK